MKYKTVIDPDGEELVIIRATEYTDKIREIERFLEADEIAELVGYDGDSIIPLDPSEVSAFISEAGAVYAVVYGKRLLIKARLYALEGRLGTRFVRINQSCIANISKIARFDASISGAFAVIFKDGYRDYISRRRLKAVKERIGF